MRPTNFATHLTAFLTSYLPAQRNVSPNTIRAYRDAFVLLLRYCRDVRRLAPDRLSLEQIDPSLVLDCVQSVLISYIILHAMGPATEGFSCRGAVMNDEGMLLAR